MWFREGGGGGGGTREWGCIFVCILGIQMLISRYHAAHIDWCHFLVILGHTFHMLTTLKHAVGLIRKCGRMCRSSNWSLIAKNSCCPLSVNTENRWELSDGDPWTSLQYKFFQLPMSQPRLARLALSHTSSLPRRPWQPHIATATSLTKPDKWFRFVLCSPGKKLSIQSAKWCQGFVSEAYEWQQPTSPLTSPPPIPP